jgi:hypothetical protein
MAHRRFIPQLVAVCFVALTACEEKHDFALGERVRRKYNPNISGVIIRRNNFGQGDVYYIRPFGTQWETEIDGPNRPDELERIP